MSDQVEALKRELASLGASPLKALGQNFLVDEYVLSLLEKKIKDLSYKGVVEIGPGLGALTCFVPSSVPLVLIELDKKFSEYWKAKGFVVLQEDALRLNWDALQLPSKTLLLSNLPYQISSSLVVERSMGPQAIDQMLLMFQKEVAQRVMASPSTASYGLLSVVAQSAWDVSFVLEAGPSSFYPPPRVASRVLHFQRKKILSSDYIQFVKKAFSQRRKYLLKNIPVSGEILEGLGFSQKVRAEELSPEHFEILYEKAKGCDK
ncbi:MAG: ribosomal RNA small subunit methyltransferase A [Bdellovibrio sp.]|nr:MAG: ribosomal RNA small subunit methyltransferase A [Bdellovibrio sp.]